MIDSKNVDIHKVIDDAMEKKDRSVSIFMMGSTASIRVEPLEKYDPRWILHNEDGRTHIRRYGFECSECHGYSSEGTSYCPHCGEKLRMPIESDFKKEATDDGN